MYYDSLKRRVHTVMKARQDANKDRTPIEDCIAPCYMAIHDEVRNGTHTVFHLPGGRGSCKSSFVSLEIVDGIMMDTEANGIVFRKAATTIRESVYQQISWAISTLGVEHLWRGSVSPMAYTYLPTGQQILFRGVDDPGKLKSLKCRKGIFKFVWFEEFSEFAGSNQIRSVLQSVVRGGSDFRIFNSFNPPLSKNSWANKYILIPDDRAIVFKTDYRMIPPDWLGETFLLEAERLQQINEPAYRHEYLGEPTETGGSVFPNLDIRTITDSEIDKMDYFYHGIDWGFSIDPAAFIRCSFDGKTQTVFILDEIVKRNVSNAELVELIKAKRYPMTYSVTEISPFDRVKAFDKLTVTCDAAEPKSIADVRKLGLRAIACKKFAGSVQYGLKWLQTKKIVIDPKRTPNAYREFTEYEYERTKDGELLASVPDANNHCIDSCRYALDTLINSARNSA